jgi:hypothetical protein
MFPMIGPSGSTGRDSEVALSSRSTPRDAAYRLIEHERELYRVPRERITCCG